MPWDTRVVLIRVGALLMDFSCKIGWLLLISWQKENLLRHTSAPNGGLQGEFYVINRVINFWQLTFYIHMQVNLWSRLLIFTRHCVCEKIHPLIKPLIKVYNLRHFSNQHATVITSFLPQSSFRFLNLYPFFPRCNAINFSHLIQPQFSDYWIIQRPLNNKPDTWSVFYIPTSNMCKISAIWYTHAPDLCIQFTSKHNPQPPYPQNLRMKMDCSVGCRRIREKSF